MEIQNQRGFEAAKSILAGLVVLLLASNLATVYWLKSTRQGGGNGAGQPAATSTPADAGKEEDEGSGQPAGPNAIAVEWQEWPGKFVGMSLYDYNALDDFVKKLRKDNPSLPDTQAYADAMQFYKVGTVTAGKYAGQPLYILAFSEVEGPSFGPALFHVIGQAAGTGSVMLVRGQEQVSGLFKALFATDADAVIANLETPDKVAIPGSRLFLHKATSTLMSFVDIYSDSKKLFEYAQGEPLYFSASRGCFFARAKDGTARVYELELPILDKTKALPAVGDMPRFKPQPVGLAFDGQAAAVAEYSVKTLARCNVFDCYNYPEYIKGQEQLKPIGKFANGDTVWGLKDEKLKGSDGNEVLKSMYDGYYPGYDDKAQKEKIKKPFAEFLADHPVVYWQDPFGRFLELRKSAYESGAECGKPVIYLYPTKTTTVSVLVEPTGGITYSEPAYGSGWKVSAEPSGELTDLSGGGKWPYLFWEGRADNYRMSDEGFVVAKQDVAGFLRDKLALLGLNEKEAADFIEFWLPRMQAKPYYFVNFVPQRQFDRMAPLTVEPRPDTVIRVFMDYKALEAPIKVKEQRLSTPVRRGFTVVEWGGELRD